MPRKLYIVLLVAFVGFVNSCSNQDEKIVDGIPASPNQFPYMVSIQRRLSARLWKPFCGGSIISKRTVLTAAHCLDPPKTVPMRIVAGSVNSTAISFTGQIRKVVNYKVHNDYFVDEENRKFNDITLVILEKPLVYTSSVQPIRLPRHPPVVGNTGRVAGWGDTVANVTETPSLQLLYISAKIYPLSDCETQLGPLHAPSQICIGSPTGPSPIFMQAVCGGDSGGPFVMNHSVQGVASFSTEICGETPEVFTSVYCFRYWIKREME